MVIRAECSSPRRKMNMTLFAVIESLIMALLYVSMMLFAGTCGGASSLASHRRLGSVQTPSNARPTSPALIDRHPLCYQPRPRCAATTLQATTRSPLTIVKGAALARPKGGDMVDTKGWLLSIVIGLGFWAFVSASLSLFIQ